MENTVGFLSEGLFYGGWGWGGEREREKERERFVIMENT